MLLLLKILTPALLIVLVAVQLIRDLKYHDKRTRRYRQVTRFILIAYAIPFLLSAITLYVDSRESSRTQEKLEDIVLGKNDLLSENAKLRSDMAQYQGQAAEMQRKIDELVIGKNDLLTKNSELLSEITKYQTDLQAKNEQIRQLEEKAKMAGRGVSSSYDFNGAKRETAGGETKLIVGDEYGVFQKIIQLERDKKYSELIAVCQQQIKKTPDWLTPYLYIGVAFSNLGDKPKAIVNPEHVVRSAPGDPHYAQANELLKQLRSQ